MLEDLIVHSAVCLSEVCIVYLSGRLLLCQDWVLGREVLGSIHPSTLPSRVLCCLPVTAVALLGSMLPRLTPSYSIVFIAWQCLPSGFHNGLHTAVLNVVLRTPALAKVEQLKGPRLFQNVVCMD